MDTLLKTTLTYLRRLLFKASAKDSHGDIYNFLRYSDGLVSSGQPLEEEFKLIKEEGFDIIINLAPKGFIEISLEDEKSIVENLGMEYFHIPVNFRNPLKENFEEFLRIMESCAGKKVWVHCAVNARASLFVYRYRVTVLKENKNSAYQDMLQIWKPFGVWKKFSETA